MANPAQALTINDLLTIPEAAERLRKDRSTIYRWINKGILPTVRVGSQQLIYKRDIEKLKTAIAE